LGSEFGGILGTKIMKKSFVFAAKGGAKIGSLHNVDLFCGHFNYHY
jgi:hypothetical protein